MGDAIAVFNAGSSSLKFSLFALDDDAIALILRGEVEGVTTRARFVAHDASGAVLGTHAWSEREQPDHAEATRHVLGFLREHAGERTLVGVGHRVVHGGATFAQPVRVDDEALRVLEALAPLAPLHQPHNLAAVRVLMKLQPALPQVACFDTAFHRTQPPVAQRFALPPAITGSELRRYGFHGLSYDYIAGVLPDHVGERAGGRVIVAHLGNGASLCAMRERRSVATTMGFTALDGLVMGTRSGGIDPGVLFYLMREKSMTPAEVEDLLYRRSGLLGVSGISSDMRELLASNAPAAREAVELFCYRAAREIGSLAAALGGLDALVFTAGIGERAAPVRARIGELSRWLGIEMDEAANREHRASIGMATSKVAVCVIPTDEEIVIARHAQRLLRR